MRKTNSRQIEKAHRKDYKALQSLQLTKKKKDFSGTTFDDDVDQEESDFKSIKQEATKERGDFTKGLVQVKEY